MVFFLFVFVDSLMMQLKENLSSETLEGLEEEDQDETKCTRIVDNTSERSWCTD